MKSLSSTTPWKLWPRGRLDIEWSDLAFALWAPLLLGTRPQRVWPTNTPHLTMHSVRTAWDALLCVQSWQPGSEIILSEANIPDMVRLIEAHGLVPVPVPVNPQTLAVEAANIEALISERTRAILISPLFGSRMDLEAIGEVAKRYNLLLVEDNAQGFSDTTYCGSPHADVTLFSFGLIKTCTALSGAVVFARDKTLLHALQKQTRSYPHVSTYEFYIRLARATALHSLVQPRIFAALWRALEWRGLNPDIWLSGLTRGIKEPLLDSVRRQPHRATLKLLRRRLRENNSGTTQKRLNRGQLALQNLLYAVGREAHFPFFWALVVMVNNREELIEQARQQGFDLSFRASSVVCHGENQTFFAQALAQAVFLPISTPMPDPEWQRLIQLIITFQEESQNGIESASKKIGPSGAGTPKIGIPSESHWITPTRA